MAKIHTLTYNGTKSSDLGVFVTGSGSFDAAEFDVDKYEIPGRNGDLILSNNRYKNIEITYPAFIPKAFMDKVQNVRNWLRSSKTYARLEDTYDMDHYRLGIPTGVQSFSPENRNDGANFEMTFYCKPQRFLKAGETPETVDPDVQTVSGEIASFETDYVVPLSSAEVQMSPQQDLNGYDSPWPGGGGKNKLQNTGTSKTENGITWTVNEDGSISANGTSTGNSLFVVNQFNFDGQTYILNGCPTGGAASTKWQIQVLVSLSGSAMYTDTGSGVTITETGNLYIRCVVRSGNTVDFVFKPMIRLASVTDATFAPYSNICPISGHTGAELNRTGINIWDEVAEVGGIDNSTGQNSAGGTNRMRSKNYIPCVPNTQYCLYDGSGVNLFAYWYDADKNYIGLGSVAGLNADNYKLDTSPSNARYMRFRTENNYGTTYNNDISINYPATDHEYHAYDGGTYSVTFSDQGTVYGGTYDFVTGKLTVTWTAQDIGTMNWTASSTPHCFYSSYFPKNYAVGASTRMLCSAYRFDGLKSSAPYYGDNGTFRGYLRAQTSSSNEVYFHDENYSDAASFKAAVSGQYIAYELATPLEYTLSPQQLTTLQGQNVVWGSGPITLTYAEPYNIENPTLFDARPLFTVTNPAEGDVIMVNGQAITFVDGYTGTVFIDCETMNAFSGAANLNSIIQATDFPVLVPGTNIVTWTGAGECTMTPRWWEL